MLLLLGIMVLTFAAGLFAELHGVFGTVVVAGVAVGAVAVPVRTAVFHSDVVQRTHAGAFAARDAVVGAEERLVGHPAVEAFADDVGLEPREKSFQQTFAPAAPCYGCRHFGQVFTGTCQFA